LNQSDTSSGPVTKSDATKLRILEAAQYLFSRRGYAETGVREICTMAEINQALVTRYFGSKLGLFEQVLEAFFDVTIFTDLEPKDFGRTLADTFFATPPEAAHAVPALVYAAADSEAREVALRLLKRRILIPLELWFDSAEADARSAQLLIIVTGFFTYRLMLPLNALQGGTTPFMRDWLADTLQTVVDRR
jgi:AcrR family transcriptional regulator